MTYKVLGERILVRRDPEQETSHLMIPDQVKKKPRSGVVLAVGEEVKYVSTDEKVFFSEYAGYYLETDATLTESDLLVLREDEILAVEISDA